MRSFRKAQSSVTVNRSFMAILTFDLPYRCSIRLIGNWIRYMQSKCRNLGTPSSTAFRNPLIVRTQYFAKGCGEIIGQGRGNITAAAVARLTQSVVSHPEEPNFVGFPLAKAATICQS